MGRRPGLALLFAFGLCLLPQPLRAETPRVVVTIPPIHALVAAVMDGRGTPELLLRGAASPHAVALRPSQARMLEQAELVVWVGPSLESFLARPLTRLSQRAQLVGLLELEGLTLLPPRHGGAWDGEDNAHHDHAAAETAAVDPHLWLDPRNAKAIAQAVAGALAALDPAGRAASRRSAR
jgi:zinc transport system substrate-binding protein